MDGCEKLMPERLNFGKDAVGSEDLPLSHSRAAGQQDITLHVIKKNLVSKWLERFADIVEKKEELINTPSGCESPRT